MQVKHDVRTKGNRIVVGGFMWICLEVGLCSMFYVAIHTRGWKYLYCLYSSPLLSLSLKTVPQRQPMSSNPLVATHCYYTGIGVYSVGKEE